MNIYEVATRQVILSKSSAGNCVQKNVSNRVLSAHIVERLRHYPAIIGISTILGFARGKCIDYYAARECANVPDYIFLPRTTR